MVEMKKTTKIILIIITIILMNGTYKNLNIKLYFHQLNRVEKDLIICISPTKVTNQPRINSKQSKKQIKVVPTAEMKMLVSRD